MGFLKSSIKSVGTLLLADFLFYGVAQSATPIFYERIDYMKKIRSYTSICRPNAQFDDDIGFLPGDEKEKSFRQRHRILSVAGLNLQWMPFMDYKVT